MKRFTETTKWDDPWFRRLSPAAKLLWQWILDHCDGAGVIDTDLELASFQIGMPVSEETRSEIGLRIIKIECGKWHVQKFVAFQYGTLSADCKAHRPVFLSLEKHGLNGYPKGIHTLQEKEKVKDTEKEKDKQAREPRAPAASTAEFLESLRTNPAYAGIDIDDQLHRMDAWLLTPRGRKRKKNHRFILNWLNSADRELPREQQHDRHQTML